MTGVSSTWEDISASHDAGATSLRDLSLPDLTLRQ